MEDNAIRTATETREDDNGGAVEMLDNRDVIESQRLRQRRMSMVAEMRYNRYVYDDRGYAERQQKRCWMMEMEKCIGRTATDWENIDREELTI